LVAGPFKYLVRAVSKSDATVIGFRSNDAIRKPKSTQVGNVKKIVLRSLLFWLLLTAVISIAMVFRPGLDLAQVHDDYMGFWDYRSAFFLAVWVPISMPVWALATFVVTKFKR
jgi:hypothetical protein